MFLVLGTDYVDVTFSADGLFGMLGNRFSVFFLMMNIQGGGGMGLGLMGEVDGDGDSLVYVPCTRHTSS